MFNTYYALPLDGRKLTGKQSPDQCGLQASIVGHVNLLLRTHLGENRFDPAYGCVVWEKDYQTIHSIYKWKADLMTEFTQTLKTYEKRLRKLEVNVELDELKITDAATGKALEMRKRLTITVEGVIILTNEPFTHAEYIFFSPLSLS